MTEARIGRDRHRGHRTRDQSAEACRRRPHPRCAPRRRGRRAGSSCWRSDRGTGMADVGRCMDDGYSTAGTPGNGLGAVARLADDVRIYSRPAGQRDHGALPATTPRRASPVRWSAPPSLPIRASRSAAILGVQPEQRRAGHCWWPTASGHGMRPHAPRTWLCARFLEHAGRTMRGNHRAHASRADADARRRGCRRADRRRGAARCGIVGVGNICGAADHRLSGTRRMVSHNGTAGHVAPRIREFTYRIHQQSAGDHAFRRDHRRWDLAAYPGLVAQHPSAHRRRAVARSSARAR